MYVYICDNDKKNDIYHLFIWSISKVALETILSLQGALTHKKVGDTCPKSSTTPL